MNHVEIMSGKTTPRTIKGELVWQKESNTFGDFIASKKTTWRPYGTKAQRKAVVKSLTQGRDRQKQEIIHRGAAKIIGLALSHIYASKPQ